MALKKKPNENITIVDEDGVRRLNDDSSNAENQTIGVYYNLSKRELDVLDCLLKGDSYKMIADACSINIGTVNSHINSIYKKLNVHSKSGVVIKAIHEKEFSLHYS